MGKVLVSYFSASGVTKKVATKIANAVKADLFEIEPVQKYTDDDLNWTNKKSRSTLEMNDRSSRPAILDKVERLNNYDKVVIGFPIWWYTAPTIINTFIEENDLRGKDIYIFVTSGGTDAKRALSDLSGTYPELLFISDRRFTGRETDEIYQDWLK